MALAYKDKVAVITGGGSGIGLAIALAFAKTGASVAILGRDEKKLAAAQKQILEFGKCRIYRADVSNAKQVKKIFSNIHHEFKHIDVLVNCAGLYGPIGLFHTLDLSAWHSAFAINFLGTANCVRAVLPFMLKAKKGKIITLSGGGAVQPFPNFSAYSTSKAAVVRFTETVAKEYENKNIQINAIAPGAVNTSVLEQVLKSGPKKVGEEFYKKSLEQKRTGGDSVENAAELVLYLCSGQSSNVTGKLISAKWDGWQKWNKANLTKIKNSSVYTLRRIDNKYFKQA